MPTQSGKEHSHYRDEYVERHFDVQRPSDKKSGKLPGSRERSFRQGDHAQSDVTRTLRSLEHHHACERKPIGRVDPQDSSCDVVGHRGDRCIEEKTTDHLSKQQKAGESEEHAHTERSEGANECAEEQ